MKKSNNNVKKQCIVLEENFKPLRKEELRQLRKERAKYAKLDAEADRIASKKVWPLWDKISP